MGGFCRGGFGLVEDLAVHRGCNDPRSREARRSINRCRSRSRRNAARRSFVQDLQFGDESIDLIAMIRVLHHLPGPRAEFAELWRVLRPGGFAVVEAANSAHAVNQVRHRLRQERIPESEVDARSGQSRRSGAAAYVNHHPRTISRQLTEVGFQIRRVLSVSNFRHPLAKAVLPERVLLAMERGCAAAAGQALLRAEHILPAAEGAGRPGTDLLLSPEIELVSVAKASRALLARPRAVQAAPEVGAVSTCAVAGGGMSALDKELFGSN